MHLRGKGVGGGAGGEDGEPGQSQDLGSELGRGCKFILPSRAPSRLLVRPQGPHSQPGPLGGEATEKSRSWHLLLWG